jgi:hypothetical protein
MRNRFTAGLLATAVGAGLLTVCASGAHAGSKGRKNTTIGLGALAAYGLLKGNTTMGLAGAAGTAYAYKRYKDSRDDERRFNRYGRYSTRSRSRYRTTAGNGDFQFPDNYYPTSSSWNNRYQNSDYYQNDRYQYQNGQYQNGQYGGQYQHVKSGSYYNSRSGDDNRYRVRDRRSRRAGYRSQYQSDDRPRGWSRGRKNGWYAKDRD